jgi:hypothetical protein
MEIQAVTRLSAGLFALLVHEEAADESPDDWRATSMNGSGTRELTILCAGRCSESATALLTVSLPESGQPHPPVTISRGAESVELHEGGADSHELDPQAFGDLCRVVLASMPGDGPSGLLARSPSAHGVEYTTEVCRSLNAIRDAVRTRLPGSEIHPSVPFAMRLDQVIRVDETAFWLRGWLRCESPRAAVFSVVTPEGAVLVIAPEAVTFDQRPDLAEVYGEYPDVPTVGFWAYVELDEPSRHSAGWVLQVRTPDGAETESLLDGPALVDRRRVEHILRTLPSEIEETSMQAQVLPTLSRLVVGPEGGEVESVADFGAVPAAPDVSIVIATQATDRIEHQVLEFARDPGIRGIEVLFVVPGRPARRFEQMADGLSSLYRLPFRLVRVSPNSSRSRTINLGASVARGRLLVLMGGDVIPAKPGWVQDLCGLLEGRSTIGVVGPRLLYEDGSIAADEITFVRERGTHWSPTVALRGFSPTLGGGPAPRRVQAVSDACVCVSAQLFARIGGLCELYLDHGKASPDLSLSIASESHEVWLHPGVALYLLERDAWEPSAAPGAGRFDRWLFERRWSVALSNSLEAAEASRRLSEPVEIIETRALHDFEGTPVVEAGLLPPTEGPAEWSPYRDTYAFAVEGWAVSRSGKPLTVEIRDPSWVVRRQTVADRPIGSLSGCPTDVDSSLACGFSVVLSSLALPLQFELSVEALDDEGTYFPIGVVRGVRLPFQSGYEPVIQPALLTTIGRSGSNWIVTLLSLHPEILVSEPFRQEAVLTSYWASIFRDLSQPASYMESIQPEFQPGRWWTGEGRSSPLPLSQLPPVTRMERWMGRESLEAAARFCQAQVDRFYLELARLKERMSPHVCVEKCFSGPLLRDVKLLYPNSKEIILVRDPRDRVCSILDYNARRGFELWGRGSTSGDDEWFAYLQAEAADVIYQWRQRGHEACLVRYEDLIAHPESTLAEVFEYLDVDSSPDFIARVMANAGGARSSHVTSSSVAASVGRWKTDLSPAHQEASKEAFAEFIAEFGYEPT